MTTKNVSTAALTVSFSDRAPTGLDGIDSQDRERFSDIIMSDPIQGRTHEGFGTRKNAKVRPAFGRSAPIYVNGIVVARERFEKDTAKAFVESWVRRNFCTRRNVGVAVAVLWEGEVIVVQKARSIEASLVSELPYGVARSSPGSERFPGFLAFGAWPSSRLWALE